ncbi:MAG: gamma-glutamyltransferase [Lewinellaceae bacterium]|nr:gamma-glutamyltransferase [Saprospiraceae bacterium]MCB9330247.1 gamma-glutamyltransferase [Lewinellaceae bacterium]
MRSAVLFLLLVFGPLFLTAQKYIPFPYAIEKEVLADSAAVVTAHPLATRVGLQILRQGGNAVDAAVAVQFALAVVYPQAGNIGGGGFMVYRAADGQTAALDFREKAPAAATETMYQDSLGNVLPNKSRFGIFACGVPGSVDGMWEAHKKYGQLPWAQLLGPAIELADKGYQVTEREAKQLTDEKVNFIKNSKIVPVFVHMHPWETGDWLIQKELANVLRRIASNGRDGFYTGPTAELIEYEMKRQNGLMTREDLENYHSVWRTPIEFDWRGLHIISMPPPSSGGILLQQMLGMLGDMNLGAAGFHSVPAIHRMVESERRAYADRAKHMGDPDFWAVPQKTLGSPEYLKTRMADFDPEHATPSAGVQAGAAHVSEETTHFSIVDAAGNAVSITTTLNDSYGSRVVVGGGGFILNNEMDDFSAKPGAPNLYGAIGGKANAVAPDKRPLSSMTPTIVTRDGQLSLVVGTPGGTTIPTSVYQVILNVYAFGLPLKEAVHNKRFHHQWAPDEIRIEEGAFSEEVIEQLQQMGHTVVERTAIGRVEAILRQADGKLRAVADDRGDDAAAGF